MLPQKIRGYEIAYETIFKPQISYFLQFLPHRISQVVTRTLCDCKLGVLT